MSLRLGLIGHPVSHSLSPPMHRAAFAFFGLAGSYELVDIAPENLQAGIEDLRKAEFSGFNVTIPHKEEVFRLLPNRSLEANLVGAANTVRIDSAGEMTAHNSDLQGFIIALKRALQIDPADSLSDKQALVLGAGGVARACLAGLFLSACPRVVVAARRPAAAELICNWVCDSLSKYLARKCEVELLPFDKVADSGTFSLVLNCTPLGLKEDPEANWVSSVINAMTADSLLFDTVYMRDRSPTFFMKQAASKNLRAVDGLDMLVEQAALAFEYWTGRRPSSELMRQALP